MVDINYVKNCRNQVNRPLGDERVYLKLYKVAGTPYLLHGTTYKISWTLHCMCFYSFCDFSHSLMDINHADYIVNVTYAFTNDSLWNHATLDQFWRNAPANTKHLYNICTMSAQRYQRWADIVQMIYKCFVFAPSWVFAGSMPIADGEYCKHHAE